MNYKTLLSKLFTVVLISSTLAGLQSCNDKDDNSLKIMDVENNQLTLYYPNENIGVVTITGGVQPYSVTCESGIFNAYIDQYPNAFNYEVLGIGEAQVKIHDSSGQSLVLYIEIQYREDDYEITRHEVIIKSETMDNEQQQEVQNKALSSIPVKIGGGYKFIFTELESGTVYVYKDKFGEKYTEGTFSTERKISEGDENMGYQLYYLHFDDQEHTYFIYQAPKSRASDHLVSIGFYENILEKYVSDYPELEELYTVQIIK